MHKCCQLVIKARESSIKYECYYFVQKPKLYLENSWFPINKYFGGKIEI